MSQRNTKLLYSIHAWTGIVTGVLLFVVCFSGAIVVFKHEIDLWANPIARAAPGVDAPVGFDTVLSGVGQYDPQLKVGSIAVPTAQMPAYAITAEDVAGKRIKLLARADTGAVLGPVDSELGQFIRSLHVFLFFGPRWIVGFLGVVMLVLIVTGILIHQKIVKDLFSQRWRGSVRLMLSDAHKVIGIWTLLFHILIAFTGAWLGLLPVFAGAVKHLSSPPGSSSKKLVAGEQTPVPAVMQSVDALYHKAKMDLPDVSIARVQLRRLGEARAEAGFSGPARDLLGAYGSVQYSLESGELIKRDRPSDMKPLARFTGLMEPLHFGDFGGLALKWLYFILGLMPALLSITGTWLWLDRQRNGGEA